ncbi:tetratricopeptide repeat protein [Planctobacterium marinum]|uniref:TPR repeat protein n=1 Tax=Planctobacterium marinum TaxID=1631968 RepID=A0AA48HQ18_9ALTE|nr:hypothetical protein MACH26_30880 [Planctobacterium marinum]
MPFRQKTAQYLSIMILATAGMPALAQSSNSNATATKASASESLPEDLKNLQTLIKQKRFSEAFALSNKLIEAWGGDPGFDLLAGQAAYGADYFQEAVFAFERVLLVKPDVLLARLYLAFSYFQVKNLGAAQTELTRLLKEDLKPADAQRVRNYLQQITELKSNAVQSHAFNVKLSQTYDSNANSGTTLDNLANIPVESPFYPIIGSLDESSLEQTDHSTDVGINYIYSRKLNQKSSISFNATYVNTQYNRQSQLDREILSMTGAFTDHYWGATVNFSGYVQPMILDSEFYRAAYGVSLDASWPVADNWQWLWGISYASVNVNANDDQDIHQYSGRTRLTYFGNTIHMFELGYGDDEGKQDNLVSTSNGKNFWLLSYTLVRPIGSEWLIIANSRYQDIEHDGINPAIGALRKEESFNLSLSLDYLLNVDWKISGGVTYTDKRSSVDIYAYDRTTATFSVTRSF